MKTGAGTELTPGQALPLKKDMSRLLQAGLVGYDQWQVSKNGGLLAPNIPASVIPHYSAHAIGFPSNFIMPPQGLLLFFKYYNEFSAKAHTGGRTFAFGGNGTLKIPKK